MPSHCFRLPLTREAISKAQKFGDVLRSGIILTAKDLRNAKAIIDGKLVRLFDLSFDP